MEKRPLFMGIGIGIMAATLFLQSFANSDPAIEYEPSPIAAPEQTPTEATPASPPPITKPAVEEWAAENDLALIPKSDWEAQQKRLKELEAQPVKVRTTIYINPGLGTEGIEPILVKSGLLPQDNRFSQLMKEKGLTKKVRSGLYTFDGQVTEEVIIEKITMKK